MVRDAIGCPHPAVSWSRPNHFLARAKNSLPSSEQNWTAQNAACARWSPGERRQQANLRWQVFMLIEITTTRMWANAQRDGRPAEYWWRPLFNATVWLAPTTRVPCSNAAKTRNPSKLAWVPQIRQQISAVSGPNLPKYTILWVHVEEMLRFKKFFFRLSIHALVAKIRPDKIVLWCPDGLF